MNLYHVIRFEITEELSKEGEPYITLCSWESASYIRDYLKMREARGEIIKSSYLFTGHDNETPLSTSRFETFWHDLYREAGADLRPIKIKWKHVRLIKGGERVPSIEGMRYNIRQHSLGKFSDFSSHKWC